MVFWKRKGPGGRHNNVPPLSKTNCVVTPSPPCQWPIPWTGVPWTGREVPHTNGCITALGRNYNWRKSGLKEVKRATCFCISLILETSSGDPTGQSNMLGKSWTFSKRINCPLPCWPGVTSIQQWHHCKSPVSWFLLFLTDTLREPPPRHHYLSNDHHIQWLLTLLDKYFGPEGHFCWAFVAILLKFMNFMNFTCLSPSHFFWKFPLPKSFKEKIQRTPPNPTWILLECIFFAFCKAKWKNTNLLFLSFWDFGNKIEKKSIAIPHRSRIERILCSNWRTWASPSPARRFQLKKILKPFSDVKLLRSNLL